MGLNPLVTREKRRKKELGHLKRIIGGGGYDTKKGRKQHTFWGGSFLVQEDSHFGGIKGITPWLYSSTFLGDIWFGISREKHKARC